MRAHDTTGPYPSPGESLPSICFILGTTGQTRCMSKLIFDNRVIVILFLVLSFVNAFAIQNKWYV